MTNKERKINRYQRRIAKRQEARDNASKACGDFSQVFSYENLFKSAHKCSLGVGWKSSTQTYLAKKPMNTYKSYKALRDGTYKSKGFHKFTILERGKKRNISSTHISERVIQKALCDEILVPVRTRSFIFDNGASQKGKGMDFSLDRLSTHLRRHFKHYGTDGYVLLIDFKSFFENAPHDIIYKENERRIADLKIRNIANQFMEDFGKKGLGLGSQVSQTYALAIASPIDHFVKEKLRIKGYGRYMDDMYLLHHDKDYLKYCYEEITKLVESMNMSLNPKKCHIVKINKGFKFLKTKFTLTKTGKVYRKMNTNCDKMMRNKLKVFSRWERVGRMSMHDVMTAYQSYKGHMKRGNSYKRIEKMDNYFKSLFGKESLRKW